MKVEKSVDSDHFPISLSLVIRSQDKSEKFDASAEDHAEAQEKLKTVWRKEMQIIKTNILIYIKVNS